MQRRSTISNMQKGMGSSTFGKNQKNQPPFFKTIIQPKLKINPPNDIYEKEADSVAEKVMRMPETKMKSLFFQPKQFPLTQIQRECASCESKEKLYRKGDREEEEENVQMKGESGESGSRTAPSIVHDAINSPGQPLDKETKNFMESRFGYEFGRVQVHNDPMAHQSAEDIDAKAYTYGIHLVFGKGHYNPGSYSGKELIAHELTHTVQQENYQGNRTIQRRLRTSPTTKKRDPEIEALLAKFKYTNASSPAEAKSAAEKLIAIAILDNDLWMNEGVDIALWLLDNGNADLGERAIQIIEATWLTNAVTETVDKSPIPLPHTFGGVTDSIDNKLIGRAKIAALSGEHSLAFRLFGFAFFILETQLVAFTKQRGDELSKRPDVTGLFRNITYRTLQIIYNKMRDIIGFYYILEQEERNKGNLDQAARYSGLGLQLSMEIKENYSWSG